MITVANRCIYFWKLLERVKLQDNVAMCQFCGQKGNYMISYEHYKGHISSNMNREVSLKGTG